MRSLSVIVLMIVGLGGAAPGAWADTRVLPGSQPAMQLSFAPLVKKAAPAVVNIYTKRVIRTENGLPGLFNDPLFRRFFGDSPLFGLPKERIQSSLGSGVLVRADGLIVSNVHVVKDATDITVALADRREFPATVVMSDPKTDLALLKIDPAGEALPYLSLKDSDELEVGDLVLAIGDPFGVGQTVTNGIVSALARTSVSAADFRFFIQTDAPINPGNSGGALVSMDGKLAGINSAIYSQTGNSVGIGFAVPANMVKVVIAAYENGGKVVRPWIGLTGQPVTADLARNLGLTRPVGVVISMIYPKGPAERAGVKLGDVVLAVEGHDVDDAEALRFRLATLPVGGDAELMIFRAGAQKKLKVALVEAPEDPPRDQRTLEGTQPLAGATLANLSPAVADELSLTGDWHGVVITAIGPDTIADRLGLEPGDIVLAVNGQEMKAVADVAAATVGRKDRWRLKIRRGDDVQEISVRG